MNEGQQSVRTTCMLGLAVMCWLMPTVGSASTPPASTNPAVGTSKVVATMMKAPLSFEANQGQTDKSVNFISRGSGYTLFLTPTESVMVLQQREAKEQGSEKAVSDPLPIAEPAPIKQSVIRMKLEGANPAPAVDGMEQLPGIVNYFIGNDPEKWRTKIPTYARVHYTEAYPGIDLAYYGNQGKLEYDFIVAPGADPSQIKLAFEGASDIRVADSGDLLLTTALGEVRLQKPVVYQLENDGHKTLVAGNYIASPKASNAVQIQLAAYDTSQPLIIDPTLVYSTYLGGSFEDDGRGITVDGASNAYVTGNARSINFPVTSGAVQPTGGNNSDAFVTKLNATGSALIYSTYLGGSNAEVAYSIAVDGSGDAYVAGSTTSSNFPTTPGAFQPAYGGDGIGDAFVTKLNPTGSALIYSTFLGGSSGDVGFGIALDGSGDAYVTGSTTSSNFPTTPGAFQPTYGGGVSDGFVTALNPTGSALIYSTYLGGSSGEQGQGIAVDGSGNAYVTGNTGSGNFPTTAGAFQTTIYVYDAFIAKLDPSGSALAYSTVLGGDGYERGYGIVVDASGNAYVTGDTDSNNFPTTGGAFQTTRRGGSDGFATKFNPTGSALIYSTYLGGSSDEQGQGIAVDGSGNVYVVGNTISTNFPTTADAFQPTYGGGYYDAFITKLDPTGAMLVYSTYLGGNSYDQGQGIALDGLVNAYVTGSTASSNFPTVVGAFQPTYGGGATDAFVTKIIEVTLPPVGVGKVTGGGTIHVSGGIGNFGFMVERKDTGSSIKGELTYLNKVSGAKIKSVSFTSLSIMWNTAVFEGACTNNGAPCTFKVTVVDNGEPGTTDSFTISVSGGPIEGGTLRSGSVQIH